MPFSRLGIRPRRLLLAFAGLCATVGPAAACPGTGALTVLVPYAAGGSVDATTRVLARAMASRLGRPVVVQNQPGASGLIAVRQLLAAPRDGCLLLSASLNNVVLLPLQNPLAGFTTADLQPVARMGASSMTLVANAALGIRDMPALRAAAASGKLLRAGHPGVDSLQAVALKLLQARLGVPLVLAPYSGAGPLVNDLIGGHIDLAVLAQPAALPLIRRGAVFALDTARQSDGTPLASWAGWFVARDVSAADRADIQRALQDTLSDAAVIQALADMGVDATRMPLEQFAQEIASTVERLKPLLADPKLDVSAER